jgi:hypothetical protein
MPREQEKRSSNKTKTNTRRAKIQKGGNELPLAPAPEQKSLWGGFWDFFTQQQPVPTQTVDTNLPPPPPSQPTSAPAPVLEPSQEQPKPSLMQSFSNLWKKDEPVPPPTTTGGSKKTKTKSNTKTKSKKQQK